MFPHKDNDITTKETDNDSIVVIMSTASYKNCY